MKASGFQYHRPRDKGEALDMLGSLPNAKVIAGGQSLVAMLNMRYAFVDHLVDVNRVDGLAGIEVGNGRVRIGAMARQRDMLAHRELAARAPLIPAAMRFIGHLHTRNRGTFGGSLVHMDPAAELLAIATILDAEIEIESRKGVRVVPIADFPLSYMTPNLEPDELVVAITLNPPLPKHGWAFDEFAQRHGDFAVVSVGVTTVLGAAGRIEEVRLVLGGMGFAPTRLRQAEDLMSGETPSPELFDEAAEVAGREEASSDAIASASYRCRLAKVLMRRSLAVAIERGREQAVK